MAAVAHDSSDGRPPALVQTLALLHPWIDFVPRPQRRLGFFVVLALVVHLAAFFFIRIDSTRAELQNRARFHISMEPVHGRRETSDSFLDTLRDPRLFLMPTVPLDRLAAGEIPPDLSGPAASVAVDVSPSPAVAETIPVVPAATPSLAEQIGADLRPARHPFTYPSSAPVPPTKTMWQWDPDLGARHPDAMPELPSPVSDTDLSPTELRVAISPDGAVQHVLLEATCQQPELDQQAILAARKLRFPPVAEPGVAWAHLTIFWHTTPTPREVVVPTPLTPSTP